MKHVAYLLDFLHDSGEDLTRFGSPKPLLNKQKKKKPKQNKNKKTQQQHLNPKETLIYLTPDVERGSLKVHPGLN